MDLTTITLRKLIEQPLDIPLMQWALFAVSLIIAVTLVYMHCKRDSLDLRWLVLDQQRKPSLAKIAQLVALTVSTWGFVVLTLKGQLTETYFIFFMATWSGSAAVEAYLHRGMREPRRRDDDESYRHGVPECPPVHEGEPR